ncbi:MAG: PriCT-2 domain-containing protein, partial [Selenomonadaceae bacterium]|nr:PriCT-2 domain-containing protein [Selenomonadaceae bacterium]
MNNCDLNFTVATDSKQARIAAAEKFFDLLYGAVTERKFGYLWTKQGEERRTFPFDVSNIGERKKMAVKAIELNDAGADVYYGINLMDTPPAANARVTADYVTMQTATVTDIDIEGGNHQSNETKKYPPTFDSAKSFLPFPVSIIINSGYGLHGLCIYSAPITITALNRKLAQERNKKFIEVIRTRAGIYSKAVDSVGDLPRVLRVPGTRNYKLGVATDAPICHIVEVNDVRFSPADIDEKLNALTENINTALKTQPRATCAAYEANYADDNPDLKEFRIRRMLDYISVVDGEYEKWLAVGFALFNEGCDCNVWEQWSRSQPEFKDGECADKWKTFHYDATGNTIGTLYQYAVEGGYDEKEIQRDWYRLHPELSKKKDPSAQIEDLKDELRSVGKAIVDFDAEKDAALEKLRNVETFDSETVFADEVVTAGAFARLFDKQAYSDFRREIKLYGDKHKDKKAAVKDWVADVRDKADALRSRRSKLITRRNQIQAQINSLSFVGKHDALKDSVIPEGYSISETSGIVKVDGEKSIPVCRRPVVITGKTYS